MRHPGRSVGGGGNTPGGIVITDKFWRELAKEALIRSRLHHDRYGFVLHEEDLLSLSAVLSWEKIYYLVLEEMDKVEGQVRQEDPVGFEQHYKDLEYKKILDQCVCAGCWNPLSVRKIPNGWEVYCSMCGPDKGFHSQYHAKRCKHYDAEWAAEADRRLSGLMEVRE